MALGMGETESEEGAKDFWACKYVYDAAQTSNFTFYDSNLESDGNGNQEFDFEETQDF